MDGCTNYNFIERVSIINFKQSKTLIKWTRNLWLKISIMNSYLSDVKYRNAKQSWISDNSFKVNINIAFFLILLILNSW